MAYKFLTLKKTAGEIKTALLSPDAYKNRTDGDPWIPIRDFLDDFYHVSDKTTRQSLISEEPEKTGDKKIDAYLASLAEHLAYHYNLEAPEWVNNNSRFLDTWWFPSRFKSLWPMALVESPASFRRRGIFVDHTELQRA